MSRRPQNDWFLESWMMTTDVDGPTLRVRTGWSKRKLSELINGQMRYNRDVINEAASALNIAPWELLMHPADANEIKALRAAIRQEAARLIADNTTEDARRVAQEQQAFRTERDGTNG